MYRQNGMANFSVSKTIIACCIVGFYTIKNIHTTDIGIISLFHDCMHSIQQSRSTQRWQPADIRRQIFIGRKKNVLDVICAVCDFRPHCFLPWSISWNSILARRLDGCHFCILLLTLMIRWYVNSASARLLPVSQCHTTGPVLPIKTTTFTSSAIRHA